MESKYAGGCLCGAVRYATNAEPVFAGNCHCKDCQRSSGGAFVPAMLFSAARSIDHRHREILRIDC